jgi:hypothetical protein
MGFAVRLIGALRNIPVDLQVVDSLEFLNKQMDADEHPITVHLSPGFKIDNTGWDYEQVLASPSLVLRDKHNHASYSYRVNEN